MNAEATPDQQVLYSKMQTAPGTTPVTGPVPETGKMGCSSWVTTGLCWLLRLLGFKSNMGHYRKPGDCWNHKTMRSNFLIAASCLRVLYQSSLQGQSSQPSELLGFGSCDVERLLSCAREHTPGALLGGGKDDTKSQLKGKMCRPERSDLSTCFTSRGSSRKN